MIYTQSRFTAVATAATPAPPILIYPRAENAVEAASTQKKKAPTKSVMSPKW